NINDKKAEQQAKDNENRDFSAEFTEWKKSFDELNNNWSTSSNGEIFSYREKVDLATKVQELSVSLNKEYKDLNKSMKQSESILKKIEGLDPAVEADAAKIKEIVATPSSEIATVIGSTLEDMAKVDETAFKESASKTADTKLLGNIRTGLMAGATVTSAVSTGTSIGAVLSATKLAEKMSDCNNALKDLKLAKATAEAEELEASDPAMSKAGEILSACTGYDEGNIKSLKNLATANAVVSGIGTATAGAGTITSAMANSKKVRDDDSESGKKKEKNLNLASNILAGVTTGTSGASTALSAVQISKAKKDSDMAEKCEKAL
ncbi:MAG: hypothetical protein IJ638_03235, partial [Alphaproteobacteria bacterium]|nr:hypothetical protein [Alphaproteobacteria bacterium]